MLLSNLLSIPGEHCIDVLMKGEKIHSISEHGDSLTNKSGDPVIKFHNAIVFPGLINSHEHLDFNLFPQLGNKVYKNYV